MMKRLSFFVLAVAIVALSSCGTFNEVGETRASVFLTIDSIELNSGAGQLVYKDEDSGDIIGKADTADITLSNRPKGELPTDASTTWLGIRLKEYQVTYYRTDGGKAVPNSFKQKMSFTIEYSSALKIEKMGIVQAEAKFQAPLWDLAVNGYDTETNNITIACDVFVEVFGETISGETVYANAWTHINFGAPVQ